MTTPPDDSLGDNTGEPPQRLPVARRNINPFDEDQAPAPLSGPRSSSPKLGDDIQIKLNNLRHNLAQHLLWGLLAIAAILIIVVAVVPADRQPDLRDIATLVFPPLVTLAGTSFAWFYATRDKDR